MYFSSTNPMTVGDRIGIESHTIIKDQSTPINNFYFVGAGFLIIFVVLIILKIKK